jgi:hypothetical protein
MAVPSSQVIASWVKEELSTEWASLQGLCLKALQKRWGAAGELRISEHIEQNITFVAEHLREERGEWALDGVAPKFEIDNEETPYIRSVNEHGTELLEKLRRIDPAAVEGLCADVLRALKAEAFSTVATHDGGVDFMAFNVKAVPGALVYPTACGAVVIGQTKRYKDGNIVKETQLREFVGASLLRKHTLRRDGKMGPLTPVICAFWTTSDFGPNARQYARAVGLWYMEGSTLAQYLETLGLASKVMAMPDVEVMDK